MQEKKPFALFKRKRGGVVLTKEEIREIKEGRKKLKAELMKNNPHPGGAGGGDGKTEDAGVELARKLGKAKADAQKDSNDILKNYL